MFNSRGRWRKCLALMVVMDMSGFAYAGDSTSWDEQSMSGNWGGLRTDLQEKGVLMEIGHKSDFLANTSGGIRLGSGWIKHTELKASLNLEKILGWVGTSAYLHYNIDSGAKMNQDYVGSFTGVDNIEVGQDRTGFFQAWVQKNFFSESLSVLAGLYPIDSEFYITEASGIFIHPPYGMASEVAQLANNGRVAHGPPIFNISTFGIRAKYTSPKRTAYLMLAINDAVPGDANNPSSTHLYFDQQDGTLAIAEIGYTPLEEGHTFEPVAPDVAAKMDPLIRLHEKYETIYKAAIGVWKYSESYNDLSATDAMGNPLLRPRQGAYALIERTLYWEEADPAQGLAGFLRYGVANPDVHQADWSGSVGLRYRGLFENRDDDIAGVAITESHASDKYRVFAASTPAETVIEATYRIQIKPWLALQPMTLYIWNPNMDPNLKNAWIAGTRVEVIF